MGKVISTAIKFIDGFTKPSKQVLDSMKKMGNEAMKAGKQIQNAGKTISSAGSSLTKSITTPIAGIAIGSIKTAANFEAAMSQVGAISDTAGEDLKKLAAEAKKMGATTAFSASESAEAMKYMAMAGWEAEEMTEGISGVMDLAAASGENLALVSDIVTDGLTAFKMEAGDSERFADVMAATASKANTNVAMMGESFKYCASTAGAMGYSIEDISLSLGIMANSGIKAGTAGTTVRNIIANMTEPTDKQAAAMKKLGLSLTKSNGENKDFIEVLKDMRSAFSGLSKEEKAKYAATLAGKQSMAGMLTLVNASSKDFKKLKKSIDGAKGSAKEMSEKMLDNLNGQITLLKSAIEGIAITIGDKLTPYAKVVVSWAQKAAEYINNLSYAQVNNILKWAGIAAAIGPAIVVFGKMVTAVGTVRRTFGTVMKTISNFGGIVGLITSPAGIVITVLAGIAIAAVLITKNWSKVKDFLAGIGNWFQSAFDEAGFSVKGFLDKVVSIGSSIVDIGGITGKYCKIIAGLFKKQFGESVAGTVSQTGKLLKTIVSITAGAFDDIASSVDIGTKVFKALLKFFGSAFMGDWKGATQGFKKSLKNIFPPNIANGMIKSFDKTLPAIKFAVGGIKIFLKILASDAKVTFSSLNGFLSSGVHNIKAIAKGIKTIFKGVTTFLLGTFTGNWKKAWEGVKTIFKGAFDSFVALCKTPMNAVIGIINGAISGINSLGLTIPDWVPGIGGKSFSINVPEIPLLYKGTNNWKGGAAVIHDRGGEIVDLPKGSRVYPHDKSIDMARKEENRKSKKGTVVITIQKLADKIEVRNDEDIDRIAEALALKLKKVALNIGVS